jgi:phenylpropionate dioxygenase-like ring-hydroxylating dioxygenase large terminal subunit
MEQVKFEVLLARRRTEELLSRTQGQNMLRKEQNDLLTQTGNGTPMGELFRRYWLPALLAEEVAEAGGAPVKLQLLSERMLAFRDSEGRLGLIDEFCAHRGVSLWFGRNEEGGIRCPYHGWKYDVNGQCMEVPSEPAESGFCNRIKLKSYPLIERGGIVWVYMGRCRSVAASLPSAFRKPTGCRRSKAASTRATSRFCTAPACITTPCLKGQKVISTTSAT